MASGKMRMIRIDKVAINIGVGESGDKLEKGKRVLKMLTGTDPVETVSKTTNKDLNIRKLQPIGCKVTLRGKKAEDFIRKAFWTKNNRMASYSFDKEGNFSIGVSDYTDFEGMKYDPEIGVYGMDVSVTLTRPGRRVSRRKRAPGIIPKQHRVSKREGIEFVRAKFKIEVIE